MPPQKTQVDVAPLKVVTSRIAATPTQQLPRIIPHLAQTLWNCKSILSAPEGSIRKDTDAAIVLHRFKTQLSTLLQDRSIQGRWAAVVLVKATIEAGGWEVLSKSNAWVRGLVAILKKSDPPTTKKLCVITLTRIFMLTKDHPTLLREITTPTLPNFVTTCIGTASNKRCTLPELQTVLESFSQLIPRHPTIFRAQESQLRSLLVNILSTGASQEAATFHVQVSQDVREVAERVFVLLHYCEPKQGSNDKWEQMLKTTITSAHTVADILFRSVIEEWHSTANVTTSRPSMNGDVEQANVDAAGLSGWKGVYAGSERLVALMRLIQSHITTTTASSVNVRIGLIFDLLTRILSLAVPKSDAPGAVRVNSQISKDEREALWAVLPSVHIAALNLVAAMTSRFGVTLVSVWRSPLDQIAWVFATEKSDVSFRTATYLTVAPVLELIGHSLSKEDIVSLGSIVKACCDDLLHTDIITGISRNTANAVMNGATTNGKQAGNAEITLDKAKASFTVPTAFPQLHQAALALLPLFLSKLPAKATPTALRTRMDQTAIFTQHKEAMLASVLNPPVKGDGKGQSSILPLLARAYPGEPEVEALLRPRMPVIRTGRRRNLDDGEDEDEDEDEEAMVVVDDQEDDEETSTAEEKDHLDHLESLLNGNGAANEVDSVPAAAPSIAVPQDQTPTTKRNAVDPPQTRSSKRLRASPIAETLLPSASQQLPGTDPATVEEAVPRTVFMDDEAPNGASAAEALVLPAESYMDTAGADSDGSDFEMPALTMEMSDDEEEEDEDEEE